MNLLKELKTRYFCIVSTTTMVHYKDFVDNYGAMEITNVLIPKMRPRTKYINLVYHFLDPTWVRVFLFDQYTRILRLLVFLQSLSAIFFSPPPPQIYTVFISAR